VRKIVVGLLLILLAALALTANASDRVSRGATVAAPPEGFWATYGESMICREANILLCPPGGPS
jgi:hypothetical protein